MQRDQTIDRPEALTILKEDGAPSRGASQTWYPDEWQRKAGCGPTVASTLLYYYAATRPEMKKLYPGKSNEKCEFVELMKTVWDYATPGRLGLNSLYMFTSGVTVYARERGCILRTRELDIPPLIRMARPTFDQCAAFVRAGLAINSPVAFLNYSRGKETTLDSWHWVTIIGIEDREGGKTICNILDGGRRRRIDFRLWYQTSRGGGGLVYFIPEGVE